MNRSSAELRAAAIFDVFGPYHLARLNALGLRCETLGIEVATRSGTYQWEPAGGSIGFERKTLFDVGDSSKLPYSQVSRSIKDALARFRPDFVLVPGWASRASLAALGWCLANKTAAIVMTESTERDHVRASWKEALKRQLVTCFAAGLVGGDPQRAYLASLGMDSTAIKLGYDVVDNGYFSAGATSVRADAQAARERLGVPHRYFLASARFIPIKNLTVLLEAFAGFCRLRPESETALVLLGDGELRGELQAKRTALNLEGRVSFPGFKQYSELPSYYGLADAFIHISRIEPWGLVVNEAMAAGLPIVVSQESGCASTLVEEGRNGFVTPCASVDMIADRLARLDADIGLAERMGAQSREIIAEWSPDRFGAGACDAARIALDRGAVRPSMMQKAVMAALCRAL